MKAFLVCATLAILAGFTPVQAGDSKSNCCDQAKATTKSSCCDEKNAKMVKKADTSVKGATLLVRR